MQNKLQELTDKLYNEGLSKGKEEGARILAEAKSEAEVILAKAQSEADAIVAKARKESEDLKAKAASDVRMASEQALQATKRDIENLLVGAMVDDSVKTLLGGAGFIKETVLAVARNFSAQESADLELVLPETLRKELEPWASAELAATLNKGVKAVFSRKVEGGFTIGPADGSWFVSLTDSTFSALIREYLRPVTKKLLFGE